MRAEAQKHWDDIDKKTALALEQSKKGVILIIDDDKEFLSLLSKFLQERGERVCYTSNVYKFFEYVGRNNLKCVIVDWRKTKCIGQIIMNEFHDRPIKQIAMSTYSKDELPSMNGVKFLRKPLPGENIYTFANKLLNELE